MSQRAFIFLRAARDRARTPGTTAVLVGSLASGLGAYLFQVIGTRALGDTGYAPISVLWTIQYLILTIALLSVEAYVTRAVTLHANDHEALRRGVRALTVWTVAVSAVLCAATWIWRETLFHGEGNEFPFVVGLIVLCFGGYVIIRGWLAGSYRFAQYGIATGIESMGRVLVVLPIALLMPSTRWIAWTLPLGPLLVLAWWAMAVRGRPYAGPRRAPDPTGPGSMPTGSTTRYLTATTIANASSQTLLAAGPLVLIALGATAAETSVFFVTITAARAPLVFAIGGVLSRVLPPLTRVARVGNYARLRRIASLTCGAALVLAALGAAVGSWMGPALVAVLFGEDFRPASWFVGLTAAGVIGATAALGLNQILIAMASETRMVSPWVAGLVTGVLTVVALEGEPTLRVVSGFVAGEAVALLGLLTAILTARPTYRPAASDRLAAVAAPAALGD